jgi:hypothetical protein
LLPVFDFFAIFASFCSKVLVCFKGDCEAQAIVEDDRPRKERKDTETESRPAPTRLGGPPCRTALSTPCIPSVFSVLSVAKSSSFLSGCGFAGVSTTKHSKHTKRRQKQKFAKAKVRIGLDMPLRGELIDGVDYPVDSFNQFNCVLLFFRVFRVFRG